MQMKPFGSESVASIVVFVTTSSHPGQIGCSQTDANFDLLAKSQRSDN